MRLLLLCSALLLPRSPANAAGRIKDIGTAAGQFLKFGADARSAAMGQAVDAFSEDANAVYWNPAGLAGLTYRHLTFSHDNHYQGVFSDFLAYAQPIPSFLAGEAPRELRSNQLGSIGVGLLYLNAGNMSEIDNTGTSTGENFTPRDYAAMVAWGAGITESIDVGIGAKYVHSRIEEEASTAAGDLGARLRFQAWRFPVTISVSGHNLGGSLKFFEQADPLPMHLNGGISVRLLRNWTATGQVTAWKDAGVTAACGVEARFPFTGRPSPERPGGKTGAALRVGYNTQTSRPSLQGLTGLTGGGGLDIAWFSVDYAWEAFGVLEDAHRFTFSFRF